MKCVCVVLKGDKGMLELRKTTDFGQRFKTIGSRIYSFGLGGRFLYASIMSATVGSYIHIGCVNVWVWLCRWACLSALLTYSKTLQSGHVAVFHICLLCSLFLTPVDFPFFLSPSLPASLSLCVSEFDAQDSCICGSG